MNIQKHYEAVEKFNKIGNSFSDPEKAIDLYINLIKEELQETVKANYEGDKVELLDGACDVFVVACGLLQAMQAAGYKVDEALKRVTENNLTKFPTFVMTHLYPNNYTFEENKEYKVAVIKDENGKIRKPLNYISVLLDDLVPGGAA